VSCVNTPDSHEIDACFLRTEERLTYIEVLMRVASMQMLAVMLSLRNV
jgi:hypothetical protein